MREGVRLNQVSSICVGNTNFVYFLCELLKAYGNKLPPDCFRCQAYC